MKKEESADEKKDDSFDADSYEFSAYLNKPAAADTKPERKRSRSKSRGRRSSSRDKKYRSGATWWILGGGGFLFVSNTQH